MLTPAFHFKILEDFLDVMNKHCDKLCDDILEPLALRGEEFDVFPLVTLCALDIICETAMGKSVDAQEDSDSDYVRAIYGASDIVFYRQRSPWLWVDWLFSLTPSGVRFRSLLATLHGFTERVIKERQEEHRAKRGVLMGNNDDNLGIKKKLAFLDLLINVSEDGKVLTDEDIREEVDTFMFEGKIK